MSTMKIFIISIVLDCLFVGMLSSDCMKPCTEQTRDTTNVYTRLNEAVNIYFCVKCQNADCHFEDRFPLHHLRYPKNGNERHSFNKLYNHLIVHEIKSNSSVAANIKIKLVTNADFEDTFTIDFQLKQANTKKYCRFILRLIKQEDGVKPGVSTDLENGGMISETSTFSVSTIAKQTTIPSTTTTITVTKEGSTASTRVTTTTLANDNTRCQPANKSMCPEMFVPVDERLCLLVISKSNVMKPERECAEIGADLPDMAVVTSAKMCLKQLLNENFFKTIPLRNKTPWNVHYWIQGGSYYHYHLVVCFLEIKKNAPPIINSFLVTRRDGSNRQKEWTKSLLDSSQTFVTIGHGDTLIFKCEASGYPVPNVTIIGVHSNASATMRTSTHSIKNVECIDSGVYTCHAVNFLNSTQTQTRIIISRPVTITSFQMNHGQSRPFQNGTTVEMICSAEGCPKPKEITITDDLNQTIQATQDDRIVYTIPQATCKNMGFYFCRTQSETGQSHDAELELRVSHCPVQFCRGEKIQKNVSVSINGKMNISLCLMSARAIRVHTKQSDKITVDLKKREKMYWIALIAIKDTQKERMETKSITFANDFGNLTFNVTINFESEPLQENSHHKTNSGDDKTNIFIIVPLAILIIIIVIVSGIFGYRYGVKRQESSRIQNSNDNGEADSGQGTYANMKNLGGTSSRQNKEEQEIPVEKSDKNVFPMDNAGRFISAEGLVYITVQKVNITKKREPSQKKKQPTQIKTTDHVEYTTIDFEKTGKIAIIDVEEKPHEDKDTQTQAHEDQDKQTQVNKDQDIKTQVNEDQDKQAQVNEDQDTQTQVNEDQVKQTQVKED